MTPAILQPIVNFVNNVKAGTNTSRVPVDGGSTNGHWLIGDRGEAAAGDHHLLQ